VDCATKALEGLERLDPPVSKGDDVRDGEVVEVRDGGVTEVDDTTEILLDALKRTSHTLTDVHTLRTKTLLRRAKARREIHDWSSLQGALDDYKAVSRPPCHLSALDAKTVQAAMRKLPAELEDAKSREMADMLGKLKQLGNGMLKPFGLSTENFVVEKGEGGGWSLGFNQSPGK